MISCTKLMPVMQTYNQHWTCSMYVFPSGLLSFIYTFYYLQLSVSICMVLKLVPQLPFFPSTTIWLRSKQVHATIAHDSLIKTFEGAGGIVLTNACDICISQWDWQNIKKDEVNSSEYYEISKRERSSCAFKHLIQNLKLYNGIKI